MVRTVLVRSVHFRSAFLVWKSMPGSLKHGRAWQLQSAETLKRLTDWRSWLRTINAPEMVIISKQWHATTSNSLQLARTMSWQGHILDPSEHRKREREIYVFVHVAHIWYMICYLYYIQKGSVVCAFYCSKLHKASYAPPGRMELCTGKAVRQVQKSRNTVWR